MIELILELGIPLLLLLLTFLTGMWVERSHRKSLAAREAASRDMVVTNLSRLPAGLRAQESFLCVGSVVMSVNYFQQFLVWLKKIFGGRLASVISAMDRGRREAVLRMIEEARARGAGYVLNVRLETGSIGGGESGRKGLCAEVIAYGTAVRLR